MISSVQARKKETFFLIYFNWMETKFRIFKSIFRFSLYGDSESQNLDLVFINFWPVTLLLSFQHKMKLWPKWLIWEILSIRECCMITCQDGNSAFKHIFAMSLFFQIFLSPLYIQYITGDPLRINVRGRIWLTSTLLYWIFTYLDHSDGYAFII